MARKLTYKICDIDNFPNAYIYGTTKDIKDFIDFLAAFYNHKETWSWCPLPEHINNRRFHWGLENQDIWCVIMNDTIKEALETWENVHTT